MPAIVCTILNIYLVVLFVRIVLSWFPIDPEGPVATFHGLLHLLGYDDHRSPRPPGRGWARPSH